MVLFSNTKKVTKIASFSAYVLSLGLLVYAKTDAHRQVATGLIIGSGFMMILADRMPDDVVEKPSSEKESEKK